MLELLTLMSICSKQRVWAILKVSLIENRRTAFSNKLRYVDIFLGDTLCCPY